MDAKEFLAFQLADAMYQLSKCYEGISDAALNLRISEGGRSPRQICEHLGEVYQAFLTTLEGKKHQWGSFSFADASWPSVYESTMELRLKAVQAIETSNDEEVLKMANTYLLAHDYYHIGQICLARVQSEREFDPYAIYQE